MTEQTWLTDSNGNRASVEYFGHMTQDEASALYRGTGMDATKRRSVARGT
jgi:hypothetical protein